MLDKIKKIGIVPVVTINDAKKAVSLAKALVAGGIAVAEITFRTSAAEEAIKKITKEVPEILIGAGTVITTEQVDKAISAGAKFLVSPGFNKKIVKYCMDKDILIIPGCTSPSDIEAAIELGISTVKFFPAQHSGGIEYIKAISAPYKSMQFMPTGGINPDNLNSYLAFEKIVACGGSWMVPDELIETNQSDKITDLCKKAVLSMLDFKIKQVTLGGVDNADIIKSLVSISSSAVSDIQITVGTTNLNRAIYHLKYMGIEFEPDNSRNNFAVSRILQDNLSVDVYLTDIAD